MFKANSLFLVLICFSIFNSACKPSPKNNYRLTIDTLTIPVEYSYLSDYFQYSFLLANDGKKYISGYNYQRSSVDVFSLTDQEPIYSVPVQTEGPNAVYSFLTAQLIALDSILVIGSYELYILNKSGEVTAKRTINIPSAERTGQEERDFNMLVFVNNCDVIWDNSFLYLAKLPHGSWDEIFQTNFYVRYDFKNGDLHEINMFYDEIMAESPGQFKYKWYPQVNKIGHKFIYSFPITSIIWSYDIKSEKTVKAKVVSLNNRNYASPYSDFKGHSELDYSRLELDYLKPHVLEEAGLIMRIHRERKNDVKDKDIFYLMVLDSEMNFLDEYKILNSDRLFPYQAISDGKGLYIPIKAEYTGEEYLSFLYIQAVNTLLDIDGKLPAHVNVK